MTEAAPDPNRKPSFEERVDAFGRDIGAAGERPMVRAADTAARVWGLIILLVGVWFLADVTFGLDMPNIPWRDLWPVALIVIGLVVVFRGMGRQQA